MESKGRLLGIIQRNGWCRLVIDLQRHSRGRGGTAVVVHHRDADAVGLSALGGDGEGGGGIAVGGGHEGAAPIVGDRSCPRGRGLEGHIARVRTIGVIQCGGNLHRRGFIHREGIGLLCRNAIRVAGIESHTSEDVNTSFASILRCGRIVKFVVGAVSLFERTVFTSVHLPLVGDGAVAASSLTSAENLRSCSANTDGCTCIVDTAGSEDVIHAHRGIRTARTLRGAVRHRHRVGAGGSDRGLVGILGQLGSTGTPCIADTLRRRSRGYQRGACTCAHGVRLSDKRHHRGVVHRNVLGSRILTSKLVRDGQGDRLAAGGCPAEGGDVVLGADQRTVAIRPGIGIGRMFWIVIGGQRRQSRQLQFSVGERSVDTDIAVAVVRDGGFNVGVDDKGVGFRGNSVTILAIDGSAVHIVRHTGEDVCTRDAGVCRRSVVGRSGAIDWRSSAVIGTDIPLVGFVAVTAIG